ncbi:MAG: hypothetical protein ACOY5F_06710 [Pseudomonadota bacterium]
MAEATETSLVLNGLSLLLLLGAFIAAVWAANAASAAARAADQTVELSQAMVDESEKATAAALAAARESAIANRPWLFLAELDLVRPLDIQGGTANFGVYVKADNVGNTPALNCDFYAVVIPDTGTISTRTVLYDFCEKIKNGDGRRIVVFPGRGHGETLALSLHTDSLKINHMADGPDWVSLYVVYGVKYKFLDGQIGVTARITQVRKFTIGESPSGAVGFSETLAVAQYAD